MKTPLTNLMRTALATAAVACVTHPSIAQEFDTYGKLIYRNLCDFLPEGASSEWKLVEPLYEGLSVGATAIKFPQGISVYIDIPADIPKLSIENGDSINFDLLDRPGHPYTIVLKFKIEALPSPNGKVILVGMNGLDDMIYVDGRGRVHVRAKYDIEPEDYLSWEIIEPNRWTTLAFAFGEEEGCVFLDGNPLDTFNGALAGSKADCYTANGKINIGGGDSFYVADIRIYDGFVPAGDELLGMGTEWDPFLITNIADWELLASNLAMGMKHGVPFLDDEYPQYRLEYYLGGRLVVDPIPLEGAHGSSRSSGPRSGGISHVSSSLGTEDNPFVGVFDGNSNWVYAVIDGSEDSAAPFAYTSRAMIRNLEVQGEVHSTGDYAAGLVGTCVGTTWIEDCNVHPAVSVSGAAHAGGIIGRIATTSYVSLQRSAFSGSISGFTAHAGGLIGWCGCYNNNLLLRDCLFDASRVSGTGKFHPILCKTEALISLYPPCVDCYYSNAFLPTEDAVHVDSRFAGAPVSRSYVAGVWNQPVTAADGNVWYLKAPTVSYADWAAANNLGAWDATDALGIPNVFRYMFNKPTGAIANPPLLSISFNANGNPVIHTPPVVYDDGFSLSILAIDDLNGTGATTVPVASSGETEIPATPAPSRFFRLKAAEK